MKGNNVIFTSQTDSRAVFICIVAIILFTALIGLMTVQFEEHSYSFYFFAACFSFFVFAPIYSLLHFKQIVLTKAKLKIIFPLLFKTKCYEIRNIKSVDEKDFKVEPHIQDGRLTLH